MNLQTTPVDTPLRLLIVNPLAPGSKLAVTKILLDAVFGQNLYIDVILLVYSNEVPQAEEFKMELRGCAFSNCNSIHVSSDLPSISDADVFMFISNFPNPNKIDFTKVESEEYFDTFYLILKIAHNLNKSIKEVDHDKETKQTKKSPEKKKYKPIILCDGLVTLHILKAICKDLPPEIFFSPTPVPVAVRSTLAEYLKTETKKFNHVHAWAADDEVFYFELEKPIILHDKLEDRGTCGKEPVGNELLESFDLDYLQLSDSWLRKELLEKVVSNLSKNPYGTIYRACEVMRAMAYVWKSRMNKDQKVYINLGVISDGSLGTIKGLPCVLPLVFDDDNWSVNKHFERDPFLHLEVKRINKMAKEHNEKLVPYCKKFLEDNIINQRFIQNQEEATTTISVVSTDDA